MAELAERTGTITVKDDSFSNKIQISQETVSVTNPRLVFQSKYFPMMVEDITDKPNNSAQEVSRSNNGENEQASDVNVKNANKSVVGRIEEISTPSDVIKYAKICAIIAWIFFMINSVIMLYVIFWTSLLDFTLAPIGTYIFPENILAAQIQNLIACIYMSAGWSFPPAMSFFISKCLWREFQIVRRQFKKAVTLDKQCTGEKGAKFTGKVECYRVRHQKLVRLVKKSDNFLCFYYGASIVGHVAVVTVLLYVIIFFPAFRSPKTIFIGLGWMIFSLSELSVAATGAILVNNSVSIGY